MFKKVFQVIRKIYANSCEVLQGSVENAILTLIWVGFLGVRFDVGVSGEEVNNITPPLSKSRLNYVRKYIPICSFRKYVF